jgi:hypothetical protein
VFEHHHTATDPLYLAYVSYLAALNEQDQMVYLTETLRPLVSSYAPEDANVVTQLLMDSPPYYLLKLVLLPDMLRKAVEKAQNFLRSRSIDYVIDELVTDAVMKQSDMQRENGGSESFSAEEKKDISESEVNRRHGEERPHAQSRADANIPITENSPKTSECIGIPTMTGSKVYSEMSPSITQSSFSGSTEAISAAHSREVPRFTKKGKDYSSFK